MNTIEKTLSKINWVSCDLETTGLDPYNYEIIEIGAVRFNEKEELESFSRLIAPKKKQDPISKKIHQISNLEIEENGVTLQQALYDFKEFIEDDFIIFHNSSFDVSFLKINFLQEKIEIPSNLIIDTLFLSKFYFPARSSHSLQNISKELNLPISGVSHRALSDARTCYQVFHHTLEYLRYTNRNIKTEEEFLKKLKIKYSFTSFKLLFPKNFKQIKKVLIPFIKSSQIIPIKVNKHHSKKNKKTYEEYFVKILDIMIFGQKVYIKIKHTSIDKEENIPYYKILILTEVNGYTPLSNI